MPWSLLYSEVSETEMPKDLSRKAARTEGKAEVTTCPIRSTTDEKVNSRVYCVLALSSNNASNASGVSVLSKRLRDITAKGVFSANRSKTWPNSMASPYILLPYLAAPYIVIASSGHLGRAGSAALAAATFCFVNFRTKDVPCDTVSQSGASSARTPAGYA